ncbi:MAG: hypothetical protein KAJ14_05170 [Candidatus Omnitrophica bacterium]|nr:hypothetical protein [Candidatus Omnitrophota bacterium]
MEKDKNNNLQNSPMDEIEKYIKLPVKSDNMGLYIFDADGNMVMQVRGWGRLQYLGEKEGIKAQVLIGNAFAEAFNEKFNLKKEE